MSEFIPGEYLVEFDRIGWTQHVDPLHTNVRNGDELADRIAQVASNHLVGNGMDVFVVANGTGTIFVGLRVVSNFTWKAAK